MLFVSCKFLRDGFIIDGCVSAYEVKGKILSAWGFGESDVYLVYNGKRMSDSTTLMDGVVHVIPRLVGGKGGFGSMLRAIGAQIEKTTNREACRDLSGRRLRDINEEKRLKNWIAQQAEREREAAERKRRKLERLRQEPKHNFHDKTYEEERSQLTEKVSDAVEQGFRIATVNNGGTQHCQKRKATSTSVNAVKKKKGCLWLDADEEGLSSSDDSSESDDNIQPQIADKGQDMMPSERGTCDAMAEPDGCALSDDSKDRASEDAVENAYKIAAGK